VNWQNPPPHQFLTTPIICIRDLPTLEPNSRAARLSPDYKTGIIADILIRHKRNLWFTRQLLYHLSYKGNGANLGNFTLQTNDLQSSPFNSSVSWPFKNYLLFLTILIKDWPKMEVRGTNCWSPNLLYWYSHPKGMRFLKSLVSLGNPYF